MAGSARRLRANKPEPAGMSLPIITFSLRPCRRSFLPEMAASVRTRVVSWKDAAARNESVFRLAFVTPSNTVFAVAGSPSCARTARLTSSIVKRSINSPGKSSVSPGVSTRTLRSIWRTITSMCLSSMLTPCER